MMVFWLRQLRAWPGDIFGPLSGGVIAGVAAYAIIDAAVGGGLHLAATSSVSSQVRDVLWFAILCGLASAATIEISKRVLRLRGRYQLPYVAQWLRMRLESTKLPDQDDPHYYERRDPFYDLLDAIGVSPSSRLTDLRDIFDLPSEQLAGQIGGA